MAVPAFSGAVLTGGASARMGTDKAFVEIDGTPLAEIAHRALTAAGARDVHAIGGDLDRLRALGLDAHADEHPGEGPLAALVLALREATCPLVFVLACDMPALDPAAIARLVVECDGVDAAVPVCDGIPQPLSAAYARRARDTLAAAFRAGERSPRRALSRLEWRAVVDLDPSQLVDLDEPSDVARYASHERPSNREQE